MTAKWGSFLLWFGLLLLTVGCRTPQPNLKPAKAPEVLTDPPREGRFESSSYPKQAFDDAPRRLDPFDQKGSGVPTRSSMGPGGGGMGGMGSR